MPRQQQIGLFGKFSPTGVDQTVGDKMRALAGLSEQVGDIAFQAGAKQRSKEGAIEGGKVERAEDGEIIPPEMKDEGTFFGQAFNRSAILAHKAQASMDIREDLDRLENEHKLDPENFKSAAKSLRKGAIANMPEELANIISADFDESVSVRHSRILKNFFKAESDKHRTTALTATEAYQDDILRSARDGEDTTSALIKMNAELDQWVDSGTMSAQEVGRIKENTLERIQEQEALSGIEQIIFDDKLSPEDQLKKGFEFVEKLRDKELKDLSPEQKDSLINVVNSKLQSASAKIRAEKQQRDIQKEKIVSNLKIRADVILEDAKEGKEFKFNEIVEQVESLHNAGDIKESERTSVLTKVNKAIGELERISLADRRIMERQKGDVSVTMNQTDVDSNYKRIQEPAIKSQPAEFQPTMKANYIKQTRVVPAQVKREVSNAILSGDPELLQSTLELIDRIDTEPLLTEKLVSANERAFVETVIPLMNIMSSPEEAIKIAKDLTDPFNKARVEARESEIKANKWEEDYGDDVESVFEGFFTGGELVTNVNRSQIESDYKDIFERFYKAGYSEESARGRAEFELTKNWKDSEFGFMKHPPEQFYERKPEDMKTELFRLMSKELVGAKIDIDDIYLLSDDETARKASMGSPDYRVLYIDENGAAQKMGLRWRPEFKAQKPVMTEQEFGKKRKSAIEKERARRAAKTLEGLNL